MDNEERVENLEIGAGTIAIIVGVIVGVVWGKEGRAVLYALLLLAGLFSPVVVWFFVRRAKRKMLRPAAGCLELILKDARNELAAEAQVTSLDTGWLAPARKEERLRMLDSFEASLREAMRTGNLKRREEKLDDALQAGLKHLVCVQQQRADVLDGAVREALATIDKGQEPDAATALQKMQDLTTAAKKELDSTNPRPGAFAVPAEKALERARKPLADAATIAKETGLLVGSPALEFSKAESYESLFAGATALLTLPRNIEPE